ncbi:hypothetical protein Fifi067_00054 [Erwinia phage Fifi067]|nr:hypothetical protein Fifi067_00054 [Erwinia phage Fifi067]WBQ32500.1 hypothetical protein [Erwinia phage Kuerle]
MQNLFAAFDDYVSWRNREIFSLLLFVIVAAVPFTTFGSLSINGSEWATLFNSGLTLLVGGVSLVMSFIYAHKARKSYKLFRELLEKA